MDTSLRVYLDKADNIFRTVRENTRSIEEVNLYKHLDELDMYVRQIQAVALRIATIRSLCSQYIKYIYSKDHEAMETLPKPTDWQYMLNSIKLAEFKKQIAPGVDIVATAVESPNEIPNSHIYWIRPWNQYAVRINGVLISGNIGNIKYRDSREKNGIVECTYRCAGKFCDKYHRPDRLIQKGYEPVFKKGDIPISVESGHISVTSAAKKKKKKKKKPQQPLEGDIIGYAKGDHMIPAELCIRNFTAVSWMFAETALNHLNMHMRHIGNRSTLQQDLKKLPDHIKKAQVSNILDQTAHDILLSVILAREGSAFE